MRNSSLFLSLLTVLLMWSCVDEEFGPVLSPGAAPTITAPASTSFVLTDSTTQDVFSEFSWSAADFGFASGTTYTVQMDLAGNNFSDPISLGPPTSGTSLTVLNEKINSELINKGAQGGVPVDIAIRVIARVSPDVDPLVSAPITLTVTPFEQEVIYPALTVPGAYQDWDPTNYDFSIFSVNDDGRYEGYIYFSEPSEYKLAQGSWDINWGDDGADGTLDLNGANMSVTEAGLYFIQADINDLTYSTVRTEWGLIGSATPNGWDSDQDMTYNPETGSWSITLNLVAGELKFRANDAWDINLGDTGADGTLEYNGDNIVLSEGGSYTVELLLGRAIPTYRLTKN